MSLTETPALLILGTEAEYIARLQSEYNGKTITIPEGRKVVFYLNRENDCKHCFCGKQKKGFSGQAVFEPMNPLRAQRLLWVKFILENQSARIVKKSLGTNNLAFVCNELNYVVICSILPNGDLKFITQYVISGNGIKKFEDTQKYENFVF